MKIITYKEEKNYSKEELTDLFGSVKWESANFPTRLVKAIANSQQVISAWEGEKLVGLINAIDDGELTAYVHYLLVHPDYQGFGIGRELTKKIKEIYQSYRYILQIAETDELVSYYEKLGFEKKKNQYPMAVLNNTNAR